MIILKASEALSEYLIHKKNHGYKTGFVPTMGALHAGHISLLKVCQQQNDITVCSIFINPTQFNNPDDFRNYPKRIEADIQKLISAGCDLLYLPSVSHMYPQGYQAPHYDLDYLEDILEGHYRPGHFQGVCQVVDRLLQQVQPDNLYLGQKDYQQCMVIKKMLQLTGNASVHLNFRPTIREADGLAMSSRNLRLSAEERRKATAIFEALQNIKKEMKQNSINEVKRRAAHLLRNNDFVVDYIAIADAATLLPVTTIAPNQTAVALIAATLGKVRLIDNMILNDETDGDRYLQQAEMNS